MPLTPPSTLSTPFEIITDTSTGLSPKYIAKNNVRIAAFKYYFANEEFNTFNPSANDDWLKKFYARLRNKESAYTSMVNIDAFTSLFTEVLNKGHDFIYLAFSSALSGTYANAVSVVERLKPLYPNRKMYVFDTHSAAGGHALNVDFAVKQRTAGKSLDEIYKWQVENTLNICHWFTVDDLFFLKRGGRISGATAVAGTVLGIKPVMHANDEGKLVKVATARGRKASLDALIERFSKTAISPENQTIFIGHGDCIDDAKYIMKHLKEKFKVKDFEIDFINPVIGVHSGPGTVALFFYGTHRD